MQRASCPSCGSPIVFATKGELATVCAACRSVVRNTGVDPALHGTLSQVSEDATPFCIGTEGKFDGRAFEVVGRLQVRHLGGHWNEWYLSFSGDGKSGWLAEAMGFLSITERSPVPAPLLNFGAHRPGEPVTVDGVVLTVKEAARAEVVGGEGTLPFAANTGWRLPFVDLTSPTGAAATIDFSDGDPVVYSGRYVTFEELQLKGLREDLPPEHPAALVGQAVAETVKCPGCGGSLERRTGVQAQALFCGYCGAGIDLQKEPYTVFAKQDWTGSLPGALQLGQTGSWEGKQYRVLAMMERHIPRWNVGWMEYLLHNRHTGYRWLIEMDGHFTWVEMLPEIPESSSTFATARGIGLPYKETNEVVVKRVVGELYWRVQAGETVRSTDYIKAPWMLSCEESGTERNWSLGKWVDPREIQEAFRLTTLPTRSGKMPHQPPPQDKWLKPLGRRWLVAMGVLIAFAVVYFARTDDEVVLSEAVTVVVPADVGLQGALAAGTESPAADAWLDQNTRWFGPWDFPSGPSAVQIRLEMNIANGWMLAHGSLYNEATGGAIDFVEELSYYSEGGETEGSQTSTVTIPEVPAGTYWLRFEPVPGEVKASDFNVNVRVTRDAALARWFVIAFLVLTLPLFMLLIARIAFVSARDKQDSEEE